MNAAGPSASGYHDGTWGRRPRPSPPNFFAFFRRHGGLVHSFRSLPGRWPTLNCIPGSLVFPKPAPRVLSAVCLSLEPSAPPGTYVPSASRCPAIGFPANSRIPGSAAPKLVAPVVRRSAEPSLTMSAEMANEIKLISGRSHPDLSERVAKRYVGVRTATSNARPPCPPPPRLLVARAPISCWSSVRLAWIRQCR